MDGDSNPVGYTKVPTFDFDSLYPNSDYIPVTIKTPEQSTSDVPLNVRHESAGHGIVCRVVVRCRDGFGSGDMICSRFSQKGIMAGVVPAISDEQSINKSSQVLAEHKTASRVVVKINENPWHGDKIANRFSQMGIIATVIPDTNDYPPYVDIGGDMIPYRYSQMGVIAMDIPDEEPAITDINIGRDIMHQIDEQLPMDEQTPMDRNMLDEEIANLPPLEDENEYVPVQPSRKLSAAEELDLNLAKDIVAEYGGVRSSPRDTYNRAGSLEELKDIVSAEQTKSAEQIEIEKKQRKGSSELETEYNKMFDPLFDSKSKE